MRSSVYLTAVASLLAVALGKPEKIRGVTDPIYHLYLQEYPSDTKLAVLGPESTADYFNIGGTIQNTNSTMYLNIGSESTSYKTVTFGATASTKAWGLEGDTIITTQGSTWGRRESHRSTSLHVKGLLTKPLTVAELNFLVCKLNGNYWQLYLQTGSDTPSGKTCSNYKTIHLPCLC